MLDDEYLVSETDGAISEFQELLSAEMKGGDLRAFLNERELTIVGMSQVPESKQVGDALSHPGPGALRVEGTFVVLQAFASRSSGEELLFVARHCPALTRGEAAW